MIRSTASAAAARLSAEGRSDSAAVLFAAERLEKMRAIPIDREAYTTIADKATLEVPSDVSGTVKNNSDEALNRISARIFVYDGEGNLVGAAEASAWDVPAGGSMSFKGMGIGQKPEGPLTYEVTALGVKY